LEKKLTEHIASSTTQNEPIESMKKIKGFFYKESKSLELTTILIKLVNIGRIFYHSIVYDMNAPISAFNLFSKSINSPCPRAELESCNPYG
jgi:hypothetical protein